MQLEPIAENVWTVSHALRLPGGLDTPGRMTVVRLPNRELWLHSPVPIDDALAAELAPLGSVAHLVAPNRFHHLHLPKVLARYPSARTYAAPGLPEKRRDVRFDETLSEAAPPAWRDAIEQIFVQGAPLVNEVVFFHRESRTLITTDLVFNMPQLRGLMNKIIYGIMGTYGELAQSRLWRWAARDRAALKDSYERILAWPFDRFILAHGAVVEDNAKERLRGSLRWPLR